MRARAGAAGLAVGVASAATHAYHSGEPPDPRAVAVAAAHGVAIDDLRARPVVAADFSRFDIIAVMERHHLQALRKICPPEFQDRITLLTRFSVDPSRLDIPDPYFGDESFESVFRLIEDGVSGLIAHLRQQEDQGMAR
jgi:protein-tyrosine phosphatase